jgi:glycosyltransferase involved in cell wall biosynthesis
VGFIRGQEDKGMEKKNDIKLSLCMVLKNEGQTIKRCLESIRDCQVIDEWIIGIDDKCTDNTEQEVTDFFKDNPGLNVNQYKYTWNDSFAEARNIGMDKATGDYILIMDGHEVIPSSWHNITESRNINSQEAMRKVKETISEERAFDSVFFMLYQQPFIGQTPNNYFMQPRIYRNGKGKNGKKIRYGRAAHNVIQNTDPTKDVHFPEVIIIHDAPEENRAERKVQRLKMNEAQLKNDLKKNKNDLRALFYLGNTLMEARKWDKAINQFVKYIKGQKMFNNELYQAYIHKGLCHKELNDENMAMDCWYKAMKVSCDRRDAYIVIGDLYFQKENYEKAIQTYSQALAIKPVPSKMFSNGPTNTWYPHQQLARCYEKLNNKINAIAHLKLVFNYTKEERILKAIRELQGEKKKILVIDAIGSFTSDFTKYLEGKGYEVVKVKEYDHTLEMWADRIWVEWADANATRIRHSGKAVIRMHGYEAYINRGLFREINWDVRKVVFVANHIMQRVMAEVPAVQKNAVMIPNGVDLDKFYIKNKERDENAVGYAGMLNVKKNPMRLARIIKNNPDKVFHLRVEWQDAFLREAFEYETADCKNIVYHGRYDDLNDFWNQVSYVISTSDIESFSYNVAEAMACGCTPLIYNWMGAEEIWNSDFIFTDEPEFNLKPMDEMREYIQENYPLDQSLQAMEQVLMGE